MKLSKEDIQKIKTVLELSPVDKAYIFGSYARGDADMDSDIDILLELDYSQHIGLAFVKIKNDLEDILKKPVDLLTEKSISKHISSFIKSDKKLIYER
ncbi:nucleotidyltransferase [Indibacter alkaliphilus LW1]|uniref:Nucleotidyltransferase n=1 Tax=Indibacter alkaliphilus (strain CCUG 57479 / KCTC 22604 / LW1) TaxID=1189612 RepID=S2D362_INDAL|nr:nucleotidyltransferase domain-containing protein [Indibacter alkaliphilus]EOZ93742.1 nucleotidyltransferase [Indibacter alkaliphilus LW1]